MIGGFPKPRREAEERQRRVEVEKEAERRSEALKEADQVGRKLLEEVEDVHEACLRKAALDLVPFSAEGAATLVEVIIGRCANDEQRREDLRVALGVSRDAANRERTEVMAVLRRELVSAIVMIRAEAEKQRQQRGTLSPSAPGSVPAAEGSRTY